MYENGVAGSDFGPATQHAMSAQRQQDPATKQAAFLGARMAPPAPADDVRPAGPVFQAIGGAEQELGALHETVVALERRLSAVLQPVPPTGESTGGQQAQRAPVSETTERVARIGLGVRACALRVAQMIERLEV